MSDKWIDVIAWVVGLLVGFGTVAILHSCGVI